MVMAVLKEGEGVRDHHHFLLLLHFLDLRFFDISCCVVFYFDFEVKFLVLFNEKKGFSCS